MDLVGPGPTEPHFEDAIGAVAGLHATGRWLDLGSGAGFPGIALAARHPEAQVLLVESRQKRATFLRQVLATGQLPNAAVYQGRVAQLEPGADGVISRAYRPPLRYLEDAARLLVPGGRAVLLLGDGADFSPPAGWRDPQLTRYRVGSGWRRRVVLTREG